MGGGGKETGKLESDLHVRESNSLIHWEVEGKQGNWKVINERSNERERERGNWKVIQRRRNGTGKLKSILEKGKRN